jgi:membrane protease YdiL (CAAX protease family)
MWRELASSHHHYFALAAQGDVCNLLSTQDLDVYRSDDFEEEVEKEGFHISPIGALIVSVSFMLLVPIILYPEKTLLMEAIWILFIVGFTAHRNSEVPTVLSFGSVVDSIVWAVPLGAIIAVVEVWAANLSVAYLANVPISDVQMSLIVVSVGAVGEELLYRSGLYTAVRTWLYRAGLPEPVAIGIAQLIQAMTFSLGHMWVYNSWDIFIALFIGGLMYGAAYEYKKDVTIPMIAHLVVNWSGFREQAVGYLLANPALIILIVLFTLALILIRRWI